MSKLGFFMLHVWGFLIAHFLAPAFKGHLGIDASHVQNFHDFLKILGSLACVVFGVSHVADIKIGAVLEELATVKSKLASLTKPAALFLVALALGSVGGCANVAAMSDTDFVAYMAGQAENDVSASITLFIAVDPTKAPEAKADCLAAKAILDGPIAQLFAGASAGQVSVAAVNSAIPLLKSKLAGVKNGPIIASAVQLAWTQIVGQLQLPGVPAATLSSRTALGVAAVFAGASKGIADAIPATQ